MIKNLTKVIGINWISLLILHFIVGISVEVAPGFHKDPLHWRIITVVGFTVFLGALLRWLLTTISPGKRYMFLSALQGEVNAKENNNVKDIKKDTDDRYDCQRKFIVSKAKSALTMTYLLTFVAAIVLNLLQNVIVTGVTFGFSKIFAVNERTKFFDEKVYE